MDKTQLLSIEITTECNLGGQHARCPNRSPLRYAKVDTTNELSDATIVSTVTDMHRSYGFRGVVAWHYYCEPLCDSERVFRLMKWIRENVPEAKFLLWTNGTLLPDDLEPFKAFSRIVITDYGTLDVSKVRRLAGQQTGVSVHSWKLDGRLELLGHETPTACGRLFGEMVIDYYGNVRPCCFDWEGHVVVGNVHNGPLDKIVAEWQGLRDRLAQQPMACCTPEACRRCIHKSPAIPALLQPCIAAAEAFDAGKRYADELRRKPPVSGLVPSNRKVAVVFVSYLKVPEERLRDHFRWNDAIYRRSGAMVYVVTDVEHELPEYAECVVFPVEKLPVVDGQRRFSLCATKNAGIARAIQDGAEVVIVADVDHYIPVDCWNTLTAVQPDEAVIPVYRMVERARQAANSHIDRGATGVIAMTAANWKRIRWDERCVGYGADDGIIMRDIERSWLRINRTTEIEHVEHPGAVHKKNVPGHGRDGCYGRDGFNFDNFEKNRTLHHR